MKPGKQKRTGGTTWTTQSSKNADELSTIGLYCSGSGDCGIVFKNRDKRAAVFIRYTATFVIYVFYDLTRFFKRDITSGLLAATFLIATLGVIFFAWRIHQKSADENNLKK